MKQISAAMNEKAAGQPYSWITAVFAWCGLVAVSGLYITIPLVSGLAGAFGVSPSRAAWVSSAFSLTYAAGFLIFGSLSEKYGKKQVILAGLAALTLLTPAAGLAGSFPLLIVLRALQGLAAAAVAPSILAYIAEMYPPEKRVTAIGFVSTGFLTAGIIGQLFSSIVSDGFGWRYVFHILGAAYFVTVFVLVASVPKGAARRQTRVLQPFAQMGPVFVRGPLLVCYLITLTLLLSFVGMYTTLGNVLIRPPFELSPDQILMVRAAGIVGMLLAPLAGRLVARLGTGMVLKGGLLLSAIGLGIIGISSNLAFLVVMSVLFVAGIALVIPTLITLIGSLGGGQRGVAISLYSFILFLGASLAPIISAALVKSGSAVLTFETFALLLGIAFAAAFFIKPQDKASSSS